jgi:aldose 1-epimerase
MAVSIDKAGEFDGKRVDEVTLTSDTGVSVAIMTWGVVVRDWQVPVDGKPRSVVLGFDSFDPYPEHSPYFGAVVGRVANRIKGASFMMDAKRYDLVAGEGGNQLHGGPDGFGRQVWDVEADNAANAARFRLSSPDGAMGYPGNLTVEAVYTLSGNRLRLDLSATPDRKTPVSMVQHQYFNLGAGDDVLDHYVEVPAGARTEVDRALIPTGVIVPVPGTQYDFRAGRTLRHADGAPIGYDFNLVLDTGRDFADPAATVVAPNEELTLNLWSDRPGLQVYNGVWTDVTVPGRGGKTYGRYSGLCLEDQMFPDALHNPHFPSIMCTPDNPYRHWCEIEIK